MSRRELLTGFLGAAATVAIPGVFAGVAQAQSPAGAGAFTLPPLGYGYDALEPHIDTQTMTIHHKNHHQSYVNALNGLTDKYADLAKKPIEQILSAIGEVPEAVRTPVRNNLGGHFNHTFFWESMTPGGAKQPAGELKGAIEGTFGSLDKLQEEMTKAGLARFGSGWSWLAVGKDKKLAVFSTANQDTPHMDQSAMPVIGIDVWEHAYYLKHQSRRADYLKAWWATLNWDKAAANFKKAAA